MYETKLYKMLAGAKGIPLVHWNGIDGNYNCMVMDLLGQSLEDLFQYCRRKFTVKTSIMVGM